MSFHLYSSNRLEELADALAGVTGVAPLPPFVPETVVVQSGGMARWLSYRLAERQGICAHLDCPFPNDFVDRVFRLLLPELAARPLVDRRVLQWQILRLLPELATRAEFSLIAGYLGDGGDLKRYQLAGRLADRFDQYLIFRPEMVLAWEAGRDEHWQARLWRELVARPDCLAGALHRGHLRARLLETLAAPGFAEPRLPARFSVFGLSSLPPFHLQIFNALARHLDLHFFLFSPSREYWGDIRSDKAIGRLAGDLSPEELYLSEGNALLASLGQQGQELFRMLQECELDAEHDLFVEPVGSGRLAVLQGDILDLREAGPGGEEALPPSPDHSLQIHACASPRRELEVLHDRLLALLEELPGLEPRDILVMTPDIELYAPLIPAVFGGGAEEGAVRIPFSIADRKLKNEGELVGAFLALLRLAGSRLELAEVLALLEQRPVRSRFGLTAADLELIERWLSEVKIRWGIDAADRAALGLPATSENTWRFGLDRLLLGYAMEDRAGASFAGIRPYDAMEGGESEVLGNLLDFAATLFPRVRSLAGRRTLAGWAELLLELLDKLLAPAGEQDQEWRFLLEALAGMARLQEQAGYTDPLDFPVVMAHLENLCQGESMGGGFLAGRATFCELLPMRAVPFRVVCLLGLNDGDYPRATPLPAFDLIAADPRPGDRSRRKDDRYLFLEALLSAREVFYLSYLGQSVRDGNRLSPSVLVSELSEYLEKRFPGLPPPLLAHPLQPFSPAYFSGQPELFSYSPGNFRGALALAAADKTLAPLVARPLPEAPASFRQVELAELANFFRNPARFFCRRRLGLYLERGEGELPDTESFTLEGLDRYQLGGALLEAMAGGREALPELLAATRQLGVLPHGSVGMAAFRRLAADAAALSARLPPQAGAAAREYRECVLTLGGFTLSGQVELLPGIGQFRYRFAAVKAADLIEAWLRHLFLQAATPGSSPVETTLVGTDCTLSFAEVAAAADRLAGLLALYWQGLRQPLPFFPESSREFQLRLAAGATPTAALARALLVWEGREFVTGEGTDPYYQLCYRGLNPLGGDFARIAGEFWAPLLECCHE